MENAQGLIYLLNRGGKYGYYWLKHDKGGSTLWFDAGNPPAAPARAGNLYFGVNPSSKRKGIYNRAELGDIAAINCLFGDFDAKDFLDESGQPSKEQALKHIEGLYTPPSILVDSGGGYQAYWVLDTPYQITDDTSRGYARSLQAAWVDMIGSDPGAKDIARVLRVPGSLNYKYNPPRAVELIYWEEPYSLAALEWNISQHQPSQPAAQPAQQHPAQPNTQPAAQHYPEQETAAYWLTEAITRAKTEPRNMVGFWLACQLRDSGVGIAAAQGVVGQYALSVKSIKPGKEDYREHEAYSSLRSAYKSTPREAARALDSSRAPQGGQQPRQNGNGHNGNGHKPAAQPGQQPAGEKYQPGTQLSDEDLLPKEHLPIDIMIKALEEQETGDAKLLAKMFTGRLVYDHSQGIWFTWRGNYWTEDKRGLVYWLAARGLAPAYLHAAEQTEKQGNEKLTDSLVKRAAQLRNKKRLDNVLFLAARHETLSITGEEWDSNPWVLGCNNGVIDLRTGDIQPGKPGDYIKSHVSIDYAGQAAQCPRWEKFIREIFDNNAEITAFMGRLLGYGITGLTTEHALPIFWGPDGRNGKSTMLETLADVLGPELATSSQADAIMDAVKGGGGPQPFVFALRGKRFVWASESNEGRRINAGLVKQLTGGDRLNVRTLHSKPVEFKPTHLLCLITNHKPHISADDQAIWERVLLVPFTLRFVETPTQANERKRDINLRGILAEEQQGILSWLVRGCLQWQQHGLQAPASITAATQDYKAEEDTLGQFITDRCLTGDNYQVRAGDLYKEYKDWCQENGMQPMSSTALGIKLKRTYTARNSHGIIYMGLGLVGKDEKIPF